MIRLKDLKEVCYEEMLVFDGSEEEVTYNESHLVVDHESERYDNYVVIDITNSCEEEHFMYVTIQKLEE